MASVAGQGIGYFLIAFGFVMLLGGDLLGGLWIAFIGWFLTAAAQSSVRARARRCARGLSEIHVSSIMDAAPPRCSP
ncbi:MAG TPA: hypothetical protein VGJ60_27665 [Chloroflexota bacterium]